MSTDSNLTKLFEPQTIWVYTDGSCTTHGLKTGSYAAMILVPDKPPQFIVGTCNWTKINRMELSALNAALYHIHAFVFGGFVAPCKIQVITDSTYVMHGATDPATRKMNRDLWYQYEELSRNYDITITHMDRNTEPAQAQADALCDHCRALLEDYLAKLQNTPEFHEMQLGRNTKLIEIDDKPRPKPRKAKVVLTDGTKVLVKQMVADTREGKEERIAHVLNLSAMVEVRELLIEEFILNGYKFVEPKKK